MRNSDRSDVATVAGRPTDDIDSGDWENPSASGSGIIEIADDYTRPITVPLEIPVGKRDQAYLIALSGANIGEMFRVDGPSVILGRGRGADVQVLDEGISRKHALLHVADRKVVIEDLGSRNGTYVNGEQVNKQSLVDGDKIQIGYSAILKFTFTDDLDESFQRQMYQSALRDGLTHAFNRKYFFDRLEAEFHFSQRHQTPLSLIIVDIDLFKNVNDEHGHLAGDHVLTELVRRVQHTMRSEDVLARYGGEEFALICRSIEAKDASRFAERVRRAVAEHDFEYEGKLIPITVSVGVATYPAMPVRGVHGLIEAADLAMYTAKRNGRNRAEVATLGKSRSR